MAMSKLLIKNKTVLDHSKIERVKAKVSMANQSGNPSKDPTRPILLWYQDTPVGKELFISFYTKKCEWARCSFCSLPSVSSPNSVNPDDILKQAEYAFNSLSETQLSQIKRLFISNNGSVLNENTFSRSVLDKVCQLGYQKLPNLEIISFETRFNHVNKSILLNYLRKFNSYHEHNFSEGLRKIPLPVQLQISGGYETQDPYIRNYVLCKGYPERLIQHFFQICQEVYSHTSIPILLDENVLLKPAPGISNQEAIQECFQTLNHLNSLGIRFNVPVSARINPTFVSQGSYLHKKFLENNYSPPKMEDIASVLSLCHKNKLKIPIFIGLNEESLETAGGSFNKGTTSDTLFYKLFQKFNATQDYNIFANAN
jgi:radical SAM enzyme (TIGR01210 family)